MTGGVRREGGSQVATETDKNDDGLVLVAVDFTPDSEAALIWALDYATAVGAAVKVLHVVHDPADAPGSYRRSDEDALRPISDVAKEMMGEFLDTVLPRAQDPDIEARVEPLVVKGLPPTRILEVAEMTGAKLIVMGSRGRTGLPHLLLGSKAERVVQLSPVPVTIVKAEAPDD